MTSAAPIAISPGQIKGVKALGPHQVKSLFSILSHPGNLHKAVSLDPEQFKNSFANQLSQEETEHATRSGRSPAPPGHCFSWRSAQWNRIPGRGQRHARARGPLLLMASKKDHTVDPVLVHSALKQSGSTAPSLN